MGRLSGGSESISELCGVVGCPDVLVPLGLAVQGTAVVPLEQELALVPLPCVPDDGEGPVLPETGFRRLTVPLRRLLLEASAVGPVGYLEFRYADDEVHEAAAVWAHRLLAFGPEYLSPAVAQPLDAVTPVAEALRRLGALAENDRPDEAACIGLDRCRTSAEWLQVIGNAAADVEPH